MAGEKAFHDVLSYVAKSKLNFSILQTPFSAQLSLKKSFAKNLHHNSEHEVVNVHEEQQKSDFSKDTIKELEGRLTIVNSENSMLKKTIEQHEYSIQILENQCKTLDDNLKVEKKRNKKERQKVVKRLEYESKIKVETMESEDNSVDVGVPTFNKFAILDDDNRDLNEHTEGIEKKDRGSQTDGIECQICNDFLPLDMILKDHLVKNHTENSDSFTQTSEEKATEETFEQYNCFYCGIPITSESYLTIHVDKCHGKLKVNSVRDQPVHSQMTAIQMMLTAMQTPKVKCDVCNKEFESDGFVQLHKMSDHGQKFAFLKQVGN